MNKELKEWLKSFNTLTEAAEAIGVCPTTVYKWIKGTRKPSGLNCLKIERFSEGKFKAENIRPDKLGSFEHNRLITELSDLVEYCAACGSYKIGVIIDHEIEDDSPNGLPWLSIQCRKCGCTSPAARGADFLKILEHHDDIVAHNMIKGHPYEGVWRPTDDDDLWDGTWKNYRKTVEWDTRRWGGEE